MHFVEKLRTTPKKSSLSITTTTTNFKYLRIFMRLYIYTVYILYIIIDIINNIYIYIPYIYNYNNIYNYICYYNYIYTVYSVPIGYISFPSTLCNFKLTLE